MPKANKDGWIRHRGGKCPVADGAAVEIRMRDGRFGDSSMYMSLDWEHDGDPGDIMAYRIHAPEQVEQKVDTAGMIEQGWIEPLKAKEECLILDYKPTESPSLYAQQAGRAYRDNPLAWRDRIKEIDATVVALEDERSALIQRLADEGLALISEPIKAEDSAQGVDMSDPGKWKAGDMIISLEEEEDISIGGTYQITEIYGNDVIFRDNAGDRRSRCASDYKWHSRPSKP